MNKHVLSLNNSNSLIRLIYVWFIKKKQKEISIEENTFIASDTDFGY